MLCAKFFSAWNGEVEDQCVLKKGHYEKDGTWCKGDSVIWNDNEEEEEVEWEWLDVA